MILSLHSATRGPPSSVSPYKYGLPGPSLPFSNRNLKSTIPYWLSAITASLVMAYRLSPIPPRPPILPFRPIGPFCPFPPFRPFRMLRPLASLTRGGHHVADANAWNLGNAKLTRRHLPDFGSKGAAQPEVHSCNTDDGCTEQDVACLYDPTCSLVCFHGNSVAPFQDRALIDKTFPIINQNNEGGRLGGKILSPATLSVLVSAYLYPSDAGCLRGYPKIPRMNVKNSFPSTTGALRQTCPGSRPPSSIFHLRDRYGLSPITHSSQASHTSPPSHWSLLSLPSLPSLKSHRRAGLEGERGLGFFGVHNFVPNGVKTKIRLRQHSPSSVACHVYPLDRQSIPMAGLRSQPVLDILCNVSGRSLTHFVFGRSTLSHFYCWPAPRTL
jgi:hypothetical protein